ncbi:MAG: 6-hydroxymethylpterin diphosphokinase MptE-like protein [Methanomassiliicoccales archaeon]
MEWAEWRPLYLQIMDDLGFDIHADLESAEILSRSVGTRRIPNYSTIVEKLGQRVSIIGAAASLEDDIGTLSEEETLISAGSATARLMKIGIIPDILVTDLDGEVDCEIEAIEKGTLAFIHAHGDNMAKIKDIVPRLMAPFVPTVQCKPFGNLYNFGGFTDGDRAVLIASHFGVKKIRTLGWDLDHPFPKEGSDPAVKSRKLYWAREILSRQIDDK